MDQSCIFCRIVRKEIPSTVVYEDDHVLGFLDVSPVRPGHTLIIPKAHYPQILDVPQDLAGPLLLATQKVGHALMKATGAQGFNMLQNNFAAAGQMVYHVHWHLIPRSEGDGLRLWAQSSYSSTEAMQLMGESIRAAFKC